MTVVSHPSTIPQLRQTVSSPTNSSRVIALPFDDKPVKSEAVHPLVELDVCVGGRTIPPAGWIAPAAIPRLRPGPQSVRST